jgi:hypothetical protein
LTLWSTSVAMTSASFAWSRSSAELTGTGMTPCAQCAGQHWRTGAAEMSSVSTAGLRLAGVQSTSDKHTTRFLKSTVCEGHVVLCCHLCFICCSCQWGRVHLSLIVVVDVLLCHCCLPPQTAGVCIRLKELIERLFPRRSKQRRAEVEAERERQTGESQHPAITVVLFCIDKPKCCHLDSPSPAHTRLK